MHLFFPDPEPPVIRILYEWSGKNGHCFCVFLLFSFVISSRLSIFVMYDNGSFKKIKSHPDVVDHFNKLPFYNKHIEKPNIKRLKNIDSLSELPIYDEPNKNRPCV